MVDKILIETLVKEKLEERQFIVGISVSESNRIDIIIDGYDGLTIDDCIAVSRHVEHNLDRDAEDFSLQVSSPGLTEKFKVSEQYLKYRSKPVLVVTQNDEEFKGIILRADNNGFVLETSVMEKPEGSKKMILVVKEHNFKYEEIKSAKAVISFK
jgi:ribosome maturation factor RimP